MYIYIKNIYILNGIVGDITVSRDNLMERIVYFEGARARRKYDEEVCVKGSGDDGSSEIDGGVDGHRSKVGNKL